MADVREYIKGTHQTAQALFKVRRISNHRILPGKELI
jgi:hypothetical protein